MLHTDAIASSQKSNPLKYRLCASFVDVIRTNSARLNTLVILGSIFSLGLWGHLNHWQFGGHDHHGEAHTQHLTTGENTNHHSQQSHEQSLSAAANQEPEDYHPVVMQQNDRFVEANGILEHNPGYVAELSTRVSGVVFRVLKRVGEQVQKGDTLALIEAPQVGEAKADLLQALVQFDLKTTHLQRLQKLDTVVSEKKIQAAEADAREAEIQLFDAQQALFNLGIPVNLHDFVDLQDQDLADRVMGLGIPESLRQESQGRIANANLIPMIAPFDGEVIKSAIVVGERIHASEPGITVADRKHYWITLNIRREDAHRITTGMKVAFQADSSDHKIEGQIDWISTAVDEETRTLQARVEHIAIDLPEAIELRSNLLGTCRIETAEPRQVVIVPSHLIRHEGDVYLLTVKTAQDLTVDRVVQLGTLSENSAEILEGIEPDDQIALSPQPLKTAQQSNHEKSLTELAHQSTP